MVDNVISFVQAKEDREKRSDAEILLSIGRMLQKIEDDELRETLLSAWRSASITFFASPYALPEPSV
jgi:hypothetical protein